MYVHRTELEPSAGAGAGAASSSCVLKTSSAEGRSSTETLGRV